MSVSLLSRNDTNIVLEITIPLETVMLDGKQQIEQTLNEAGAIASGELLKSFDTDGSCNIARRLSEN